jgi:hypothetical protein
MNARFLLLPVLALFVALAGCDSGVPTDGLQTSPTVPTANVGYLTGYDKISLNCGVYWDYHNPDDISLTGSYWTVDSGPVTLSYLGVGHVVVWAHTTVGGFTVSMRDSSGAILATQSGAVTATPAGHCQISDS